MSVISEPYSYEERVLETGGQFSVGMPITLETTDYEFMADFSELLKRRCYRNYEGYVHFVMTSSALISSLWIWLLFYGGPLS